MSAAKLIWLGGLAAVMGGAGLVLFNIVEYVFFSGAPISVLANSSGWFAFEIAGLLATILVTLGLFCVYAVQAERAGTLGIVGFVLALEGVLLYDGLSWAATFVLPAVGRAAPAVVDGPDPMVGAGVLGTVLVSSVGWIVFGAATLRAGVFPRWQSVLLLMSAIAPFALQSVGSALPVGVVLLGTALMGMGQAVLSRRIDAQPVATAARVPV